MQGRAHRSALPHALGASFVQHNAASLQSGLQRSVRLMKDAVRIEMAVTLHAARGGIARAMMSIKHDVTHCSSYHSVSRHLCITSRLPDRTRTQECTRLFFWFVASAVLEESVSAASVELAGAAASAASASFACCCFCSQSKQGVPSAAEK